MFLPAGHCFQDGTNALRALGFAVIGKDGKHIAPASHHRSTPSSRAEMMEGIVFTMKQAYSGEHVNVATWDTGLKLDLMKCCGLVEFGIAQSGNGLEYAFAVFRGAGELKWRGESWRTDDVVRRNRINYIDISSFWCASCFDCGKYSLHSVQSCCLTLSDSNAPQVKRLMTNQNQTYPAWPSPTFHLQEVFGRVCRTSAAPGTSTWAPMPSGLGTRALLPTPTCLMLLRSCRDKRRKS